MNTLVSLPATAEENFARLRATPYPGRGLIVGRAERGDTLLQVYWLTGRSANSQNRVIEIDGRDARTNLRQPDPKADTALTIYYAFRAVGPWHIVGNGDQTDEFRRGLPAGEPVGAINERLHYEPDAPIHTPRITACAHVNNGKSSLWLCSANCEAFEGVVLSNYTLRCDEIAAGRGLGLVTYAGQPAAPQRYRDGAMSLPLRGSAREVAETYWSALDPAYRIALAVKAVPLGGGPASYTIINQDQPPHERTVD